jgi:pilus assembly protein Flp/PilA
MIKNFGAFLKDESGSTAVEYGVFAACIAASIMMAIGQIGPKLSSTFARIADELPGVIAFGP